MCVKYFNVSTVGIVCSLTPLFVCAMAYFLLGERMRIFDVLALVAVFVSVSLVIMGAEGEQRETMGANFWATAALISQPILLAAGAISMRQMRKLPETVCSSYQNITLSVLAATIMIAQGVSFNFVYEFSYTTWALLATSSMLTVFTQMAKFKAFRYHEAS